VTTSPAHWAVSEHLYLGPANRRRWATPQLDPNDAAFSPDALLASAPETLRLMTSLLCFFPIYSQQLDNVQSEEKEKGKLPFFLDDPLPFVAPPVNPSTEHHQSLNSSSTPKIQEKPSPPRSLAPSLPFLRPISTAPHAVSPRSPRPSPRKRSPLHIFADATLDVSSSNQSRSPSSGILRPSLNSPGMVSDAGVGRNNMQVDVDDGTGVLDEVGGKGSKVKGQVVLTKGDIEGSSAKKARVGD